MLKGSFIIFIYERDIFLPKFDMIMIFVGQWGMFSGGIVVFTLFSIYFQQMKRLLIWMMSILSCAFSMRIPCEYTANKWNPKLNYPLSGREAIVSTLYNFDMIVDPLDGAVSKTIQISGTWQSQNMHVIAYFLKPGFRVLNLGSQSGMQAILMGSLIGSKGELHIFEPYSVSYNIVKKNIYLNDLENITKLYKVGASDTQSYATMLINQENTGGAQIFLANTPPVDKQRNGNIMEEVVQVDLVDAALPEDLVIDFVLMDVEKMEVEALLGMKKLIERSKDIIMFLEWQYMANSKRNQAKTMRLLAWLKEIQMKAYKYIQKQHEKCAIGRFEQIPDLFQLLKLPVLDILIMPKHIDPNTYPQL